MKQKPSPCIYAIVCLRNGAAYVGSTVNVPSRWNNHKSRLRSGNHDNSHLQNAWRKYGEGAFSFTVLEQVQGADCLTDREQYWLDKYRAVGDVYNHGTVAYNAFRGEHFTDEHKEKIRQKLIGKQKHWIGRKHTDATKKKMGQSQRTHQSNHGHNWTGKTHSEETKLKMAAAAMGNHHARGCTRSHEVRVKNGAANARPYPAFVNSKTGDVIPPGLNLSLMCKGRSLSPAGMGSVVRRVRASYRGWSLYE